MADISNSGHAMNSGQNGESQMWQSFLNYFAIVDTSQWETIFLRFVGVRYSEVSLYKFFKANFFPFYVTVSGTLCTYFVKLKT